ncbi:thiol-disulfide oxidoreductase ResA [Halalkalibacter alkalisediminis]|uniref:Thiol-disulfide oxidoreductase ResA n=1 Tax=Halalkalibacter alkalisediminis TaxID=935616 RepID=A0ABV6NQ98_9BACI|nr:thiol-disulfide oxidoreductase ResA [Halalkalibacter alkalisediminis]
MRKRRLVIRTSILSIIAISLVYTFYSSHFSERNAIQAGDKSLNFVLYDLEGKRIELDELKGQGVFLNFWGTYCPECVKEMPIMNEMYQEYADKGIELIAINAGESNLAVERFTEKLDLTFPITTDKGNVFDAYGVNPLPTTVLIDADGVVVDIYTGPLNKEITREFMERIKPNS